jgi:hypothetical protein
VEPHRGACGRRERARPVCVRGSPRVAVRWGEPLTLAPGSGIRFGEGGGERPGPGVSGLRAQVSCLDTGDVCDMP